MKYRSAPKGTIFLQFQSVWNDRHGTHIKPMDKSSVDVVCVYCPETDECYYVQPKLYRRSVTLRITPSRNNQQVGVLHASRFRHLPEPAGAA